MSLSLRVRGVAAAGPARRTPSATPPSATPPSATPPSATPPSATPPATTLPSAIAPNRPARIGAGLILMLGALTAIGPFTIDLYLAAFPQITADMGTQPGGRPTDHHRHPGRTGARSAADRVHLRRDRSAQAAARRAGPVRLASIGIVFVTSVEALTALRFVAGAGRLRRHGAVDGDRPGSVRGHSGRQGAGPADAGGRASPRASRR